MALDNGPDEELWDIPYVSAEFLHLRLSRRRRTKLRLLIDSAIPERPQRPQ